MQAKWLKPYNLTELGDVALLANTSLPSGHKEMDL